MNQRPDRRSQRLDGSLPDFRALLFNGREKDTMNQTSQESKDKVKFFKRQSFAAYEDLMKFVKTYERQYSLRLNASMITPDRQPSETPDGQYYRFVAFWCNYNPFTVNQKSAYTPIDNRFCPFFIRATGCAETNSLVITEITSKHIHKNRGIVFGLPPLPALKPAVTAENAVPAKPVSHKNVVERQKMGAVSKHSTHRSKLKTKPRRDNRKENVAESSVTEANRSDQRTEPDSETSRRCAICDQFCPSTEAYVGHVWLVHQILTEKLKFR